MKFEAVQSGVARHIGGYCTPTSHGHLVCKHQHLFLAFNVPCCESHILMIDSTLNTAESFISPDALFSLGDKEPLPGRTLLLCSMTYYRAQEENSHL